jgi:hypothetical protein
MLDAGCSMLVGAKRKSRFIGDTGYKNDFDPYFILNPACQVVALKERRLETRIQYLLPKSYFQKLDSFVKFFA